MAGRLCLIKQTWCTALQVDVETHAALPHVPKNLISRQRRGYSAEFQQAPAKATGIREPAFPRVRRCGTHRLFQSLRVKKG